MHNIFFFSGIPEMIPTLQFAPPSGESFQLYLPDANGNRIYDICNVINLFICLKVGVFIKLSDPH